MKFVFIALLIASSISFAQATNDEAVNPPQMPEPINEVHDTYAKPTPVQKKRVITVAKKAKKAKKSKKNTAVKSTKKKTTKKAKKSTY